MDKHVRWLRRKILRDVLVRTVAFWAIVSLLIQTLVMLQRSPESTLSFFDVLPWALLIGQFAAAVRLGVALVGNPLNYGYLKRFSQHPYRFVSTQTDGELHPVANEFAGWNLQRVVTVKDASTEEAPLFDVLQTPSKLVTAAIGRESGTVSLVSRLSDDRILLTTNLMIPPRESLVVNTVLEGDAMAIAKAHAVVTHQLGVDGVTPMEAQPTIFRDVMQLEHRSYDDLGPFLGSFCNLDASRGAHRLMVNVQPDEVLHLSLT